MDLAGAADADPEVFGRTLEILAADPAVGGVLVVGLFGGYGIRFAPELTAGEETAATAMAAVMKRHDKPLVVHTMYASHRSSPLSLLGADHVPVIESLDWRAGASARRGCGAGCWPGRRGFRTLNGFRPPPVRVSG